LLRGWLVVGLNDFRLRHLVVVDADFAFRHVLFGGEVFLGVDVDSFGDLFRAVAALPLVVGDFGGVSHDFSLGCSKPRAQDRCALGLLTGYEAFCSWMSSKSSGRSTIRPILSSALAVHKFCS